EDGLVSGERVRLVEHGDLASRQLRVVSAISPQVLGPQGAAYGWSELGLSGATRLRGVRTELVVQLGDRYPVGLRPGLGGLDLGGLGERRRRAGQHDADGDAHAGAELQQPPSTKPALVGPGRGSQLAECTE